MANVLNLTAPKYAAPADWQQASIALPGQPLVLRTGTYLASQAELDAVVEAGVAAGIGIVYLDLPPMGFSDSRLQNPNAFYPTPALLAEYASGIAADAATAVEATMAGTELGYVERLTTFTTTNIVGGNAAGNISGLTLSIVGTGRPVDIDFFAGAVKHSVAGANVAANLVVNGGVAGAIGQGTFIIADTAKFQPLSFRRRAVFADGVTYNLGVCINGATAGTTTLTAASYFPISLSVTSR